MLDHLRFRHSVTIVDYRRLMVRTSCGVHCAAFALLAWMGSADLPPGSFALLLFSAVVARSLWGARRLAHAPLLVVGLGRRTARGVYLLMYVLVGVELIRAISTGTSPHTERCLPYLGYVIAAQVLIRLMTTALCAPVKSGGAAGTAGEPPSR